DTGLDDKGNPKGGVKVALDFKNKEECSGDPKAIIFNCGFPEGCPICLDASETLGLGLDYEDVKDVCVQYCITHGLGGKGVANVQNCQINARPSANAPTFFPNGCLPSGVQDPAFKDPRRAGTGGAGGAGGGKGGAGGTGGDGGSSMSMNGGSNAPD